MIKLDKLTEYCAFYYQSTILGPFSLEPRLG